MHIAELKSFAMTKEEYVNWFNPLDWTIEDCNRADRHLKEETVNNFTKMISKYEVPKVVKDWMEIMASVSFGCCETDAMLTELKCYPEYMERTCV